MQYIVYKIVDKGLTVYIGRTNNLKRRQSEHNTRLKSEYKKEIYEYFRQNGVIKIVLEEVATFKSKTDAKRYEMLLILEDYFSSKTLKQKVPQIKDF